jgi:hypothetical protein
MKFKESTNNKNKLMIHKITCLLMFVFGVTLVEAKQHKFKMTIDEVMIKVAPKLDYKVFAFNLEKSVERGFIAQDIGFTVL